MYPFIVAFLSCIGIFVFAGISTLILDAAKSWLKLFGIPFILLLLLCPVLCIGSCWGTVYPSAHFTDGKLEIHLNTLYTLDFNKKFVGKEEYELTTAAQKAEQDFDKANLLWKEDEPEYKRFKAVRDDTKERLNRFKQKQFLAEQNVQREQLLAENPK